MGLLDGFEFIPSDGTPFVTLDKQRRFYLNASARKLIGAKPYDRLAIMYSSAEKAIAIVKPGTSVSDVEHARTSSFNIDRRYYMSARKFSNEYAYPPEAGPYEFIYDRGASDGSAFIFRLRGD